MATKYQVWIRDSHLAGHIIVDCSDPEVNVLESARRYARDTWDKDVVDNDVSVCRIPSTYYQEMARSTAKDSIALGM